jgi:SAM-dependent methyltransferase
MDNKELTEKYNSVYQKGASTFYSFNSFPESKLIIEMIPSWNGLKVLEIGCGEGRLAAMISFAGAKSVDAIDYSKEAIKIAKQRIRMDNLTYICSDYKDIDKQYDIVVLQGVLEHLDDPFGELKKIIDRNMKTDGALITSSPSFINPRGYVWMTLQFLFDVPMSLTDIHFLCPFDFKTFAVENNYNLDIRSCDQDWGAGERTIVDFKKRLTNALRDANMDNRNVGRLLEWLQKAVQYHNTDIYSGATVAYRISN